MSSGLYSASAVQEGKAEAKQSVRDAYQRLRPLEKLQAEKRGWALDVLQVVQSLNKTEFLLSDVYARADVPAKLIPKTPASATKSASNSKFRDLGLLTFLGGGSYRLP